MEEDPEAPFSIAAANTERQRMSEYRDKVVQEILNSEKTYVEQIELAVTDYLEPLRNENIMESEDITKVFSVLELIKDVNKTLRADLCNRIEEKWDDNQCIGDIFLTLGHFLKMYSQYCSNFQEATETLIKARENNRSFRSFEQEHILPLNSIESYLILPVQRIPRYYLLLEDFLLNTWEDHKDYPNLVDAVTMIKGIADYVNTRMNTLEYMNRVYQIDLALGGECKGLVQPSRRWVAEGEISRIRGGLISFSVPVRLYLFNDLLIVAEKTMTSFRFRFQTALLDTFVLPEVDGKFKNVFKVASLTQCDSFSCKSAEDKEYWVSNIETAIADLINSKTRQSRLEYKFQREELAETLKIDASSVRIDAYGNVTVKPKNRLIKASLSESATDVKKKHAGDAAYQNMGVEAISRPQMEVMAEFQATLNKSAERSNVKDSQELKSSRRKKSTLFSSSTVSSSLSKQSSSSINNSSSVPYSAVSSPKETSPLVDARQTEDQSSCYCVIS